MYPCAWHERVGELHSPKWQTQKLGPEDAAMQDEFAETPPWSWARDELMLGIDPAG